MTLEPGTSLGHYEILSQFGKQGIGEHELVLAVSEAALTLLPRRVEMPTVNVQLYGSTDTGFAIIISPWCAVVSLTGDKEIQWISDRQLKIVYDEPGHFPNHAASPNSQAEAKSGQP